MRSIKLATIYLAAVCGCCAAVQCMAQAYPNKTVRVITPWPTGGLTDVVGRLIFQKISETAGQQFVIDNRAGASGTIGADIVAKSKPDGYTLMVHSTTHVGNPHIYKQLPYDTLKDFVGIGLLSAQSGLLVVHPSLPVKSVKELIAFAKAHPNEILYASSGSGSFSHLAIALLTSMTKTQMTHVPYKGGGPATTAIVSGETQFLVGSPAAVVTQLNAKRLRLLAVSSESRLTQFPNVPTVAEAGVPGYEFRGWVGVFAPAGTPKAVVDWVNAEIKKAQTSPDMQARLEPFEPWYMTPEQTAARIKADYEKYGYLIKLTGTKLE
ncbi:MAG: tripartite tricarboxylate transporter substrate binding protein [Burkholderiales bacterium]